MAELEEDDFDTSLVFPETPDNSTETGIKYGPLSNLRVIKRESGAPLGLLADGIFNSAFALTEWIEQGQVETGMKSGKSRLLVANQTY